MKQLTLDELITMLQGLQAQHGGEVVVKSLVVSGGEPLWPQLPPGQTVRYRSLHCAEIVIEWPVGAGI